MNATFILLYIYLTSRRLTWYISKMWLDLENQSNCHIRPIPFIGQANSHTHALPIYRAITRFGWLVCFSRASFTDHVNSLLRKQDTRRALHGGHGSKIHPNGSEMFLRPSKVVWAHGWHFLDSELVQTVLT